MPRKKKTKASVEEPKKKGLDFPDFNEENTNEEKTSQEINESPEEVLGPVPGDDGDNNDNLDSGTTPDGEGPDGLLEPDDGEDSEPEENVGDPGHDEDGDDETDANDRADFQFQDLCTVVTKLLGTPEGKRLGCRLRVENPGMSAIVYQGMRSNVWARIKSNGRHRVYRHALKKLLLDNEATKEYFDGII